MAAFKPSFIAMRTLQFLEMISKTKRDDLPQYLLLRTLGLCVSICPPPTEQRRQILGLVWGYISAYNIPEHYINCAEVWIHYTVQHFGVSIVLAFKILKLFKQMCIKSDLENVFFRCVAIFCNFEKL